MSTDGDFRGRSSAATTWFDSDATLYTVDSHFHLFDLRLDYEWLKALPKIHRNYELSELLDDAKDVRLRSAVAVEANPRPTLGMEETTQLVGIARHFNSVCVPYVPMEDDSACEMYLEELPTAHVRSVRRVIQPERPGFCLSDAFRANMKIVQRLGFMFELCFTFDQFDDVLALVRAFPAVSFVVNHIGKPDMRAATASAERDAAWRAGISALAAERNVVACKLSGAVTEADVDAWTFERLRPFTRAAYDAFGAERTMFGSDWPVLTLGADMTYAAWARFVASHAPSAEAAHALMHGVAERVYRLPH